MRRESAIPIRTSRCRRCRIRSWMDSALYRITEEQILASAGLDAFVVCSLSARRFALLHVLSCAALTPRLCPAL